MSPPYQSQYSASYPPRYEEEEGPGPFLRGASLVAFGGFVGLTAAAAARWLNGGDFELLPPPAQKETHNYVPHVPEEDLESGGDDFETDDRGYVDPGNEEFIEDDENFEDEGIYETQIPDRLMEHVQSIAESMKANVSVQEKILQKLSRQGSTLTNQSMEMLRASSEIANADIRQGSSATPSPESLQLWAELLQIKGELRALQDAQRQLSQSSSDQAQASLDHKIGATILKLDSCIESIGGMFSKTPANGSATTALVACSDDFSTAQPKGSMQSVSTQLPGEQACSGKLTVRQSIAKMARATDPAKLRVACQLMYLYLINLSEGPNNPRYRKIFTGNDNFKKVEAVDGAKSLLMAVGFEESKGCLEWLVDTSSPTVDALSLRRVQDALQALSILKSGNLSPELEAKALAVLTDDGDASPSDLEKTLDDEEAVETRKRPEDEETESVEKRALADDIPMDQQCPSESSTDHASTK